jgi:hypothetical protein
MVRVYRRETPPLQPNPVVLRPIAHLRCDLMANERKDTLAMAIDVRLAELWAELFELRPEHLDMELLGWFLRAAYGQGYTDALRETQRGQLCLDLGYAVPDTAA